MTDTFHEDKLKAARIYIAELIDKLDAAKFELAAVRNATLEEAAMAADEAWMNKDGPPGDAIRALATPAIGEGE